MAPGPVIEDFNVIEYIRPGQTPGFIYAFSDPFFFQRTEERFGHRIILAIATPAHARRQVIGPAEALPVVTAVLAALDALLRVKPLSGCCRSACFDFVVMYKLRVRYIVSGTVLLPFCMPFGYSPGDILLSFCVSS